MNSRHTVITFPYAGGNSGMYFDLTKKLSNDIDVVSFDYPGHGKRISEKLLESIDDIVSDIFKWFEQYKPTNYSMLGYSMGGTIAKELYIKLRENGFELPQNIFFVSCAPMYQKKPYNVKSMNDTQVINLIKKIGGTSKEVFNNKELLELVLPVLKADFIALDEYKTSDTNYEFDCNVYLIYGSEDIHVKWNVENWFKKDKDNYIKIKIKGNHFFIHEDSDILVDLIKNALDK